MWERVQTRGSPVDPHDLGTRKTALVVFIVVGCFAVLWPKVFYPMMVGSQDERMRPNDLDKGCCNVISDQDVTTIEIMTDLCNKIVQPDEGQVLTSKQILRICQEEVLDACGIDISAVLEEKIRLGRTFKQIVDDVRSLNGSLCLKHNFGISPGSLGAPHRVATSNLTIEYIRQERPTHLRPEMLHPALREKGRAIPQPYSTPKTGSSPRIIEGRPGPVPGVRPPMGGVGHVVPPQKSSNNMGLIMPIYTIGIVIFFTYTLMKVVFKKNPDPSGRGLYEPLEPDPVFRKEVFEAEKKPRGAPSIVNAMSALLDEVDHEMEIRRRGTDNVTQQQNGGLANGSAKHTDLESTSIKVLGMETTASCEGGGRWGRPESPVTPPPPKRSPTPPQEIFLEGQLPARSQLLVTDTKTEPDPTMTPIDPGVVVASKMTLNVISSLDDNGDNDKKVGLVEDLIDEESKYTTASGFTAAEKDDKGDETDDENDAIDNGNEECKLSNQDIQELKHDLNSITELAQKAVDTINSNQEEVQDNIDGKIETRGARSLDNFLGNVNQSDGNGVDDDYEEEEEEDDEEEEIEIQYEDDDDDEEEVEADLGERLQVNQFVIRPGVNNVEEDSPRDSE